MYSVSRIGDKENERGRKWEEGEKRDAKRRRERTKKEYNGMRGRGETERGDGREQERKRMK